MATEGQAGLGLSARDLISFELYKRSQGRRLRQLTVAGVGVFVLWGLKSFNDILLARRPDWMKPDATHEGLSRATCDLIAYGVPLFLALLAAWALFRMYNWPRFADFLIATEAEMGKVSWSTQSELKRATLVVLLTLFLLSGFLLGVDMAWSWMLEKIGVLDVRVKPKQAVLEQRDQDDTHRLVPFHDEARRTNRLA